MSQFQAKKMASAASVFKVYWKHTRPYALFVILVAVFGVVLQASTIIAPLYMRRFFNLLATSTPNEQIVGALLGILSMVVLLWFVEWVSRRVQDFSNMYLEAHVMSDLFVDTFEYLIGHSYSFFTRNFAGSLTHRVTKFARAYELLFDSIMIQFFPTALFVIGAIFVLSLQSIVLGAMLGVWCVAFVWFQIFVSLKRQPLRTARSDADTKVTGTLADAISNHSTIESFAGEQFEHDIFRDVVHTWRDVTHRSWYADGWIWAGIGLFMLGIEAALLYGAVLLWQRGLLTIGDFVLIQAYLMTTFDRLVMINRELRRFFDAYADASEMVAILETPHEVADVPGATDIRVTDGVIDFKDVTFSFDGKSHVLKNFDLHIAPREKIALVGPSGAGKSTITRLLVRLYDVQSGTIEIDGQNIQEVGQQSLRSSISFVPQEPILFHRTLMENIRYGRRDATDAEVVEAAKKAHCHEFITTLTHGYDTFVGERGVRLSGGERQRVAIARAILKDSPILILDEATSSLDSESEALIQDALRELMKGKTVIVIAHRLSTIMKMDRILVIQDGKIASEGSHEDLLKGRGLYEKLWSIQAGGFLQD